jgi:hypothetical protein
MQDQDFTRTIPTGADHGPQSQDSLMKTFQSTIGLTLSALAIFCAAGSAHAALLRTTTTPGAACKLNGVVSSKLLKDIESRPSGTTNINPINARIIACPISTSHLDGGADTKVHVAGSIKAGSTIGCTLESRDFNGAVIASRSFDRTGTGVTGDKKPFSNVVDFTASEMRDTNFLSMSCSMPAAFGATILGIKTVALDEDN